MAAFLVNGWPAHAVDAGDRGLMYGDGVFRTMRVRAGRPCNWACHLRLLHEDCRRLGLEEPPGEVLLAEIARLAPGEAVAKVIVTRGASGRGYGIPEGATPTRIVAAYPPAPDDPRAREEGVRVRRCELALGIQPRLAGVKSLNRLESVLARAEWTDPQVREGLLLDAGGRLVEGTMSNVFLVADGRVVTPALTRCGVRGSQRVRVLALARSAGLACEERDVAPDELERAQEVFLANSLIGIWPVADLDGHRWAPGPVTGRLQALVESDDAREG